MKCGAKKRAGGTCGQAAGWGTGHPGTGRCKLHGGKTPSHETAGDQEKAKDAVRTLGLPREVEPHEALLEEVYRTAGHVAWLGEVVAQLEQKQLVHGITKTVQLPGKGEEPGGRCVEAAAAVNVWVKLYQEERDRLVRVAKAAVDAGVAERQVRIAEGQAQELARVVTAILTDLGHDVADEKTRKVVRLRLLEGGQAA